MLSDMCCVVRAVVGDGIVHELSVYLGGTLEDSLRLGVPAGWTGRAAPLLRELLARPMFTLLFTLSSTY